MKKFFIALCMLYVAVPAMGRNIREPGKVTNSDIQTHWKYSKTLSDYTDGVGGTFAPDWQFKTKAGTYGTNNEGSIVAIVARKIWEHGGYFCTTQIQAAWSGAKDWIDYFSDIKYKCKPICEPGYSGDTCEIPKYDCLDPNVDYLTDLNDVSDSNLRLLSGKDNANITNANEMKVFYSSNNYDKDWSAAVMLGVIKRTQHSVTVAPIYVRTYNGTVDSAYSNGKKTVLCAPGYSLNSAGDDCVLANECDPSYKPVCQGFREADYKEDKHVWITENRDTANECKAFVCSDSNYGFDSEYGPDCKPCTPERRVGVNKKGVCRRCDIGQFFDENDTRECQQINHMISKLEMLRGHNYQTENKQCWRKTNLNEFWGCVLCSNDDECWYNDGGCKRCE